MFKILTGWVVAGVGITLLIVAGVGVLGTSPAEPVIAKVCVSLTALAVLARGEH
ncbi:hypothetical protein [Geobacter sp. AOG2]|uniref:hypothetical protein n=1 Tax=Geobacter sp. AOG2 TaxID=1566347 RepID=UPI001CC5F99E|nr:hypothetical protein [Geobacter sp. AOG2]GFE62884.1 hypothetical protein AOG2_34730 [Geobacter sp. AOG2]